MNKAARMQILSELRSKFPGMFLWLREDPSKEVRMRLGEPLSEASGAAFWRLSPEEIGKTLEGLYEGGWAIFFSPAEDALPRVVPEMLPTKPFELRLLVGELGAAAAVVSWYDDLEWIIAFPRNPTTVAPF